MSPSTEEIRLEIEATKSRLAEKLNLLEGRVTDSLELTGTAIATASSIRRTAKSVTSKVRQTVGGANDSLGVQKQVEKHPWLTLAGAAMFGYLIAGLRGRRLFKRHTADRVESYPTTMIPSQDKNERQGSPDVTTDQSHSENRICEQLLWTQLRSIAVRTLGKLAEETAYRAVPYLVDNVIGKQRHAEQSNPQQSNDHRKMEIDCKQSDLSEGIFERGKHGIHS